MDKEAFLSWLAEIHRIRRRNELEYPNVPAIGHFVMFSNDFRWNSDCEDEMLQLGNASGLHFSDFMERVQGDHNCRGSCSQDPATVERKVAGAAHCHRTSWGHTPEHSSCNDSASSDQRSPPPESVASNECYWTDSAPSNRDQ